MQNTMWNLRDFAENTAVVQDDGQRFSYAELADLTDALADKVPPRSLVFNLCENSIESLVGYVSFINHRIVPLMLDAHIDRALLDNFLTEYKPDYLWLPADKAAEFDGKTVFEQGNYALVKRADSRAYPLYDELALLLTTSGSTGSPKFVRQSYKNIRANTDSIVEYLKLDSTERPITTLPMNYTYGISILNTHLAVGATILMTQKTLMQREFWDFFMREKATSFGGVPYTYEMLDKLMFFRRKLPDLRTMTQAGGKILPALHKKFAEYAAKEGKHFVVMYGQAEATARMAYLPPEKALEKCGSTGVAIPGGKFDLIDANGGKITTPDTVGELVYTGDNVTLGYAVCGADLAKGDERGGVLQTGDMAQFDADGYFYIVGRKKRFLKIFGNRVGLDETERLIKTQYPELDCACAGKDDAMKIFITDAEKTKEVQNFVAEKTHLNFTAFHVEYIEKIPKNDAGKTLYQELNER